MNRLSLSTRLFAAAAAATVTLSLFGGVVAIAEPQQSVLSAKLHQHEIGQPDVRLARSKPAAGMPTKATPTTTTPPTVLAVAMNNGARLLK